MQWNFPIIKHILNQIIFKKLNNFVHTCIYVRQGPEFKENMDFTEDLYKKCPAYQYKPSQTYLQWKFNNTQTFETEKIRHFTTEFFSSKT